VPAALFSAAAVLLAALVKGAISFGFPPLATPLLALVMDVKSAIAVLIIPNIVMDAVQLFRLGDFGGVARRMAVLLVFGAAGTVLGTWLLVLLPPSVATFVLGAFALVFVALSLTRRQPVVPTAWAQWLAVPVGLIAGVVGGVTNTPGLPLVMYFYALRLSKHDFIRSVAFTFVIYKVIQVGTVVWFGLLTWYLLGVSLALTVVAVGGFRLGLILQDRLEPATFNRAVLVFLGGLGIWLVVRAVR